MTDEGEQPKQKRGFASMDLELRRAIASKGGKSVPAEKRSFTQNRALAKAAGSKGGSSVTNSSRAFSRDRDLAVESGRKGGTISAGRRLDK